MNHFFEKVQLQFRKKLPFVLYSKPNCDETIALLQPNDALHYLSDFSKKGFVFSPFNTDDEIIFFPDESSEIILAKNEYNSQEDVLPVENNTETTKQAFEQLVTKAIQEIKSGSCKKIVVSRKEEVKVTNFNFKIAFQKMLNAYPNAFKYCWYHPKVGMWLGATPEQLLKIEKNELKTVALAGTRLKDDATIWGKKEIEEQQLVTDYIVSNLGAYVSEIKTSAPYTATAGTIQHIKTDIYTHFKKEQSIKKIIDVLHPTPAVCGYPKDKAKQFILQNENYDRSFYAGFLGEINQNAMQEKSFTELFVNLRCMQILDNTIALYVGCGITDKSNPEKEYLETVNKALTMKKIIL